LHYSHITLKFQNFLKSFFGIFKQKLNKNKIKIKINNPYIKPRRIKFIWFYNILLSFGNIIFSLVFHNLIFFIWLINPIFNLSIYMKIKLKKFYNNLSMGTSSFLILFQNPYTLVWKWNSADFLKNPCAINIEKMFPKVKIE